MIPAIDHSVVVVKDLAEQDRDGAKYVLLLDSGAAFYLDTFDQVGSNYVGKRRGLTPVVVSSHDGWHLYSVEVIHVITTRDAIRHNLTAATDAQKVQADVRGDGAGTVPLAGVATVPVPPPVPTAPPSTGQYL